MLMNVFSGSLVYEYGVGVQRQGHAVEVKKQAQAEKSK
jgi:hypothetical protein